MRKIEPTTPLKAFQEKKAISQRALMLLHENGIYTIADLVAREEALEELHINGEIAPTFYDKLNQIIRKFKKRFKQSDDNDLLAKIGIAVYNDILEESRFKDLFQQYFPSAPYLHRVIKSGTPHCLKIIDNQNRRFNTEIRHMVYDFATMMVKRIAKYPGHLHCANIRYTDFVSDFSWHVDHFTPLETYRLFFDDRLRARMDFWYDDYFEHYLKASESAKIKKIFPTFVDFLPFLEDETALRIYLSKSRKRMYYESCTRIQFAMQILMNIGIKYNEEMLQFQEVGSYFPFLGCEEFYYIEDFYSEHRHYPYFYLAVRHLKTATVFNTDMFDNTTEFTLKCMYRKKIRYPFRYFSEDDFKRTDAYIHLFSMPIAKISDSVILQIIEEEGLNISLKSFIFLFCVMTGTDSGGNAWR